MADVVVVGGGVLGTMHAWAALSAGHRVTQLEGDAGPRRASVRNFGLVWVSGRAPGDELAMALRARAGWARISAEVPDVGFRATGSLTVALDDRELAVLAVAMQLRDAAERGFDLLDPASTRRRNPAVAGAVAGALWCPSDAVVEPGRVLGALRTAMTARGGYHYEPCWRAVEASASGVVDVLGRAVGADVVIVCPGADHQGVGGRELAAAPVQRCRLQMMETEPLEAGPPVTTALADVDSLRYYPAFASLPLNDLAPQAAVPAAHRMQLLVVQRLDGRLTIGDTHAYDEPFPVGVDEAPYGHLRQRAEAILGRPLPPVTRRWSGVYSQRIDGGICWRQRLDGGAWLVTAPGGRGMTLSPAIARDTLADCGLVPS